MTDKKNDVLPFAWPVRIYYEDTDHGGVVYNANYLKYMERARTEMLRVKGIDQAKLAKDAGILFAVRKITVEYLSPARFNDELVVTVEPEQKNRLSMSFRQNVYRVPEGVEVTQLVSGGVQGKLLCEGQVQIVVLNSHTLRPQRLTKMMFEEIFSEHR